MIDQLRQTCRKLLEEGAVKVVIGYGQDKPSMMPHPVFITKPEECDRLVWNDLCFANLAAYITRKEIKALGKPAVIVKGCDERALVVLEQESQFTRDGIYVIGVACTSLPASGVGNPRAAKCASCAVRTPRYADVTIGEAAVGSSAVGSSSCSTADAEFAQLDEFMKKTPAERFAYWKAELSRCVKCYACREVCPMCYCNRCIVDKNRPTAIDTSATIKGNLAWHIARAFHQAGRCVGCDECTRACPAGINLRLLNQSLAKSVERAFAYKAGMDKETPPVIGSYSLEDKENFIQ
ncbi:MAG: 4Fe-4S dicluster domain-containing protein [Candidatus Hydrogenedentes bacterium]|nr:4Fe-4S dicluster domain-containing protein [Candidatus Hydrogenedentota bacterium]